MKANALEHLLGLGIKIIDFSVKLTDAFFLCQLHEFFDYPPSDMLILKGFGNYNVHLSIWLQANISAENVFVLNVEQISVAV